MCSPTRSPSRSSLSAHCGWSSAARWISTLRSSATGQSSPPARRYGTCSPTRRASWPWMRPLQRTCSLTGAPCAAGSPASRRSGSRAPREGNRRCSTGIRWASSSAASTVAASADSRVTRSARPSGWTSRSGSARPTRPARSRSPDSTSSAPREPASPSSTDARSRTRPERVTPQSSIRLSGARRRSRR